MYFFGMDVSLTVLISIGLLLHILELVLVIKIIKKIGSCRIKPQLKQIAEIMNSDPEEDSPKPVKKKTKQVQKFVKQKATNQKVEKPVEKTQPVENAEFEELEGERL